MDQGKAESDRGVAAATMSGKNRMESVNSLPVSRYQTKDLDDKVDLLCKDTINLESGPASAENELCISSIQSISMGSTSVC